MTINSNRLFLIREQTARQNIVNSTNDNNRENDVIEIKSKNNINEQNNEIDIEN